ncbi:hypothetical protein BaRGS_00026694 [Batillaria attramentaria]|uniref:Uncharacterized protein n=1 Tax=Batillaria attramentaria TaxID=370345 RepID=A0ABD0K5C2_9CAEN
MQTFYRGRGHYTINLVYQEAGQRFTSSQFTRFKDPWKAHPSTSVTSTASPTPPSAAPTTIQPNDAWGEKQQKEGNFSQFCRTEMLESETSCLELISGVGEARGVLCRLHTI